MKAVVFAQHGPPEVLTVADLPDPHPGRGQLRIRVRAAGVQPFDALVRAGMLDVGIRFPQQLGNEFAGVVDQLGSGVTQWAIGHEVIGWAPMASHAEFVIADVGAIVAKPAGLGWLQAGSLGASGQTALTALRELRVRAGETLLVHAAAGGAGSMAVQLARQRGARVIGTASTANHDHLRRLGAEPISYGEGLLHRVRAAAPAGVDAALDGVGGTALRVSVELVGDRDRVATLVDHGLAGTLGVRGIRAQRSRVQLVELARVAGRNRLEVPIRASYPLHRVREAHRDVGRGHGAGKVVLTVGEPPGHDPLAADRSAPSPWSG